MFLGDIVDGSGIYPGQEHETAPTSARKQMVVAADAGNKLLVSLAKKYPKSQIAFHPHWWVWGNHGRIPLASRDSNFDLMVYERLAPNSQINEYQSSVFSLGGHRFYARHRGPRHAATKSGQMDVASNLIEHKCDTMLAAHWHEGRADSILGGCLYIVNGCLCGPTPYSEQLNIYSNARQAVLQWDEGGPIQVSWLEW
jgi:hypothetical protein